ncbi:MAG: nucleotide exchange factor GrpE [Anaerolineae bacterium]|jgi:molecular chaperone GrpE
MNEPVKIPVRVLRSGGRRGEPIVDRERTPPIRAHEETVETTVRDREPAKRSEPAPAPAAAGQQGPDTDWCDRALRLQAEMENYRKRQQRLARDRVEEERQRLLRSFLGVVDDLERALQAPAGDAEGLRQGVQLTHRAALRMLEKEGVEEVPAESQPFDPAWHEAVSTVPHRQANTQPDTVLQVVEPGYRLDGQLLRPAKVIVAV